MNLLITGCGGLIGQSIIRIIKSEFPKFNVIGTDLHQFHYGKILADNFFSISKCSDKNYFIELNQIIENNKIDIIIPTSEPEIRFFAENYNLTKELKTTIISNKKSLNVGFSKYETTKFLKQNKFPYLRTYVDFEKAFSELTFPCIVKDDKGSGSKSIIIARNEEDLRLNFVKGESIIQEFVSDDEGEYTSCAFRSQNGETRVIVFRRVLEGPLTNYGRVVNNQKVKTKIIEIAEKLDLVGSINLQFRLKNGVPYIFEINPRFSSTVMFRQLLGFKDVIWSIEDKLNSKLSDYSPPIPGKEFYRTYSEVIIND